MHVKPAPGLLVRDPVTKLPMPPEGADIDPNDLTWARRLRDGDVVPSEAPLADAQPQS